MTALALILCGLIAISGVLAIFAPSRSNDLVRFFADQTGLWIATAIRAFLGLTLLAAAGESKLPMLLRILGLIILIVAIAMPLLGLERHKRMIDWWLAQSRGFQIIWGASAFVLGLLLIYVIL